jgi:microsomal dipeptidase-like Zn-dependent dipeptidase
MGRGRRRGPSAIALAAIAVCGSTAQAGGRTNPGPFLANHCFTVASAAGGRFVVPAGPNGYRVDGRRRSRALRFHLKPTGLGTYLFFDAGARMLSAASDGATSRAEGPGRSAEWSPGRRAGRLFSVRATANGRVLAVDPQSRALVTAPPRAAGRAALFRLARARGCRRYPEATVGARGRPFRGTRPDGSVLGFADPHVHVPAAMRAGGQVIAGEGFDRFGITEALGHDADVHGSDGSLDFTGNLLRSGEPAGTHDTHGWPTFAGWPTYDTYTHQQIYYRWLQRVWMAGMRLVVAQTVEDESLCNIEPRKSHTCDETDTIEVEVRWLRSLQDYVDAQSGGRGRGWFRLVYNPRAARRAIARGKLAVIIGVESSDPFGCSELKGEPQCDRADIDRGIARMRRIGVRSMFLAHWVDNALAGAALEGGDKGVFIGALNVAQTGEFFRTGPCPYPEQGEEVQPAAPDPLTPVVGPVTGASPEAVPVYPAGRQCNTRGLTDLGDYAVRRLMDAHMLIEVDHLSEWARQQVLSIAEQRRYPLVSSHTGTGGLWTPDELQRLYAVGGFASARIDDAAKLPEEILAFRRYGARPGVGLGTDTGGFNALPGPAPDATTNPLRYPFRSYKGGVRFTRQRTGERTFDLNTDGVAHYGLLPDLLADVQRQPGGRRALALLFHSANAYLRTWQLAVSR